MEKGKKKHTGTFVIHVSHCDNATWQGEVTWAEANKKKRSIHELFRYMERFMNELNFPQSSTELRTYEDKQQKPANEKRISFTEVSNREQILEQRGSIDTLAVYVRYRQSATWQGSVYHMKNNEREDFNSELDLLKIIENCQNSTKNVAESG